MGTHPPSWNHQFSIYREFSKSGIVTLVLISVLGGYFAGQPLETSFQWVRLFKTLLGILFLASGSSALNQIQERAIDAEMPRTATRPLPSGRISLREAWAFVLITLILGLVILQTLSGTLLIFGILAVISYNGLYTLWWKKHWAFAAIPGAIPGALPILMGYAAASGEAFSAGGLYLFFILFFWQMPHFWVLALRYQEDYSKGGIPTLPVALGSKKTMLQITIWCLGYVGIAILAPLFLHVGGIYCLTTFIVSAKVLWELRSFQKAQEKDSGYAGWLRFFLWVNFSLIIYIAAACIDRWSYHWLTPYFTR